MREKKYAHVLEEYEEMLKKSRTNEDIEEVVEDDEEKIENLSTTRQIKYKELQNSLDSNAINNVIDDDVKEDDEIATNNSEENKPIKENVEDILENTDHLQALEKMPQDDKEEHVIEENSDEDSTDVKIEQVSGKSDLDDLYLTTSFQPFRKRFKLSKLFKKIIIIILIIGIVGGIGYFGIYPLAQKYIFNTPKKVFERSIDYVSDMVGNIIPAEDENNKEIESLLYKYNIDFNSDIEGSEILSDYNYAIDFGVDFKKNIMLLNGTMDKGEESVGISLYQKEKDAYLKYSTDDNYMLVNNDAEEVNGFELQDIFNSINQVSTSDMKYAITADLNIYKSLLDDKYLSKDKDEITIDGKAIEVTRNTLKLDQKAAIELDKKYYEKVKEDKKLLEILAIYEDMATSEYEDYIDNINVEDEYEKDYEEAINIYTTKGNKFVGFDIEENGFRVMYYYTNNNEFDFYINLTDDEVCQAGMDCAAEDKTVFQVTGEKKDNETETVIKYNNKKIATLYVKTFTKDLIDLDYELNFQGVYFEGTLKIEGILDKNKSNIDLNVKTSEFFMNLKLEWEAKYNCDVEIVKGDDFVPYSEEEDTKRSEKFSEKLDELGILDIINETATTEITENDDNSVVASNAI